MRAGFATIACLALAACSQRPETGRSDDQAVLRDAAEPTSDRAAGFAAPGITLTAAPGVAFAYRYAFRLPSEAIAKTQEAHAQACEKLGVARCRITGMRYRLLGENNIEAMLAFKLDPAIARGFGKDGIATVETARGTLVDAEVTGTDAGTAIKQLDVQRVRTDDALQRIDRQLADPKLKSSERAELQRQRGEIVQALAVTKDSAAEQQASLATTPMVFEYGSGAAVRGFDTSAPLTSAADTAIGSAQFTLALLLGGLALLGPPGLLALAVYWLWRRFRPRRGTRPVTPPS